MLLKNKRELCIFLFGVALAIFAICSHGCGSANANSLSVELINASDASQCYVIMQNGNAVGGNCK